MDTTTSRPRDFEGAPGNTVRSPYSDRELEAMVADLESELVERKASLRKAPASKGPIEKIRQAVCAFANDLPGHGRPGVVFVGVRDDGTPSGIEITDRLLQRLADIKTDGNTVPPPVLRTLAGSDVRAVGCSSCALARANLSRSAPSSAATWRSSWSSRRMLLLCARAHNRKSGSGWVPAGPCQCLQEDADPEREAAASRRSFRCPTRSQRAPLADLDLSLAESMRVLGLVQRFGMRISIAAGIAS